MTTRVSQGRQPAPVTQFSVFTENRMGRLHDLIGLLSSHWGFVPQFTSVNF
jgi:hypothetical protein